MYCKCFAVYMQSDETGTTELVLQNNKNKTHSCLHTYINVIINHIQSKTVHACITPCPNPGHCVNFEPGNAKLYSIDDHLKL